MPISRSHPPDHVHFAPGLAGTVRWMAYRVTSRSGNAVGALVRRWRLRVRPVLVERAAACRARVRMVFLRSAERETERPYESRPYESLADAVRQRG